MPEIPIRRLLRVQNKLVPVESGVIDPVGGGDEDAEAGVGGVGQLPAHFGDGVVEDAAGVVCSFAD